MSDEDSSKFQAFPSGVYFGLTRRQYAAIMLRVPSSGDEWLDEMIREARHMDASAAATTGILASGAAGSLEDFADDASTLAKLLVAGSRQP